MCLGRMTSPVGKGIENCRLNPVFDSSGQDSGIEFFNQSMQLNNSASFAPRSFSKALFVRIVLFTILACSRFCEHAVFVNGAQSVYFACYREFSTTDLGPSFSNKVMTIAFSEYSAA